MRHILFAGASAFAMLTAFAVHADTTKEPDDHAPIGVMANHLHKQGEWMVSYKYEHTRTSGYRNGSHSVSNASVLAAYGEAATTMDMGMHMFEIMYGLSDHLTLMVMPQYMQMEMTHQSTHGGGYSHTHETSGFGDTEVTGLYSLYRSEAGPVRHRLHLNAGASLPTGSINETFVNHHDDIYHLPYNMQFGSGTLDPIIGATYSGASADWSWGAQTLNYIRFGKNNNGYRQGDRFTATAWAARNLSDIASMPFRLKGEAWGNVSGRDGTLPLTAIAGARPDKQAGERILAHIGLNLLAGQAQGPLAGHRLAAEFGVPLFERATGPQPDTEYRFTLGWQWAF